MDGTASGGGQVFQAGRDQYVSGRDLHVHHGDGIGGARRVAGADTSAECPYPGLATFDLDHAQWFYGRDRLVAELVDRLDERLRDGGPLAVVGPSGAGKSSLLRAGLLAALARGALPAKDSAHWPRILCTPTAHPCRMLADQLAALPGADAAMIQAALVDAPDGTAPSLRTALPGTVVLVVDQFEELFTQCTDTTERRRFLDALADLARPRVTGRSPVALVVYGIRADFYGVCVNEEHLRAVLRDGSVPVGPMSETELRQAIVFPAADVGLEFEPGLIEVLLADLGVRSDVTPGSPEGNDYDAGKLPLLAHALRTTWQRRHGSILTMDAYRETGGIRQAIATTAERVFTGLAQTAQSAARMLFLQLVRIGSDVEDTRRRTTREYLLDNTGDAEATASAVAAFTQARLLTQERGGVEITHEALLGAWPRLRTWIESDRAGNLIRQNMNEASEAWDRGNRDNSALYRGRALEDARLWAQTRPPAELNAVTSAFLTASIRQQRHTAQMRRAAVLTLVVLTLVACALAGFAFDQRAAADADNREAHRQLNSAVFHTVVSEAGQLRTTDSSIAAQLDLVAYRMSPSADLYTDLLGDATRPLGTVIGTPGELASQIAMSPDGRTLAAAETNGAVWLWNVADPSHPALLGRPLTGHRKFGLSVAFSPDGQLLASGSDDGTVLLWNVHNPADPVSLGVVTTEPYSTISVAFSADSTILAVGDTHGQVRLFDLTQPARPKLLPLMLIGYDGSVDAMAFSRSGAYLADGVGNSRVELWNLADRDHPVLLSEVTGNQGNVTSVAFSPDNHLLASGDFDGGVLVWNITAPANPVAYPNSLRGTIGGVSAIAFAPDGQTLAASGDDQKVRLWNLTDPSEPLPVSTLVGHTGRVTSLAFGPAGDVLATASFDRTLRLWRLPRVPIVGPAGQVASVAISTNGAVLAGGSADGTVRTWSLADPLDPRPLGLADAGSAIRTVALSPDGKFLAGASADGTVRFWATTGTGGLNPVPVTFPERLGTVRDIVFRGDGQVLATLGGDNGTLAQLWQVSNPAHPVALGPPIPGISAVAFSPDGTILATTAVVSGGDELQLWNIADPGHPRLVAHPLTTGVVTTLAYSPDRRVPALVAGMADNTVQLWNVARPAAPTPIGQAMVGHTNVVYSVAFASDGGSVASGSVDGTVRLWSTAPGRLGEVGQPLTADDGIGFWSVALSPDGHTLVAGAQDGTIQVWTLDPGQAIQAICAGSGQDLTRQLWSRYVPALPYAPPCAAKAR